MTSKSKAVAVVALILALCCVLMVAVSPALAESARIWEIRNVSFESVDEQVRITFKVHVSDLGPAFKDTVAIRRSDARGVFLQPPVAVLKVGREIPAKPGWHTVTWTDVGVEVNKTYHYDINGKAYNNAITVLPKRESEQGGGTQKSATNQKQNQKKQNQNKEERKPGLFEKALATIVEAFANFFLDLANLVIGQDKQGSAVDPLGGVVFRKEPAGLLYPGPFTEGQWQKMDQLYGAFLAVAMALYFMVALANAYKFMYAGANKNPQVRSEAQEALWRSLFSVVIMAAGPVIVRLVCAVNNLLVDGVSGAAGSAVLFDGGLDQYLQKGEYFTGSAIGTALAKLAFAWIGLKIIVVYWIREWVIAVIYVFTPFMAVLWALNKNVTAASVWLGEILTNAFLPTAYAIAAAAIVVLTSASIASDDRSWAYKLLGLYLIASLGNVIRNGLQGLWTRWAGLDEEGLAAKAMGFFGLGGIAGLGRLGTASFQNPATSAGQSLATGGSSGVVSGNQAPLAGGAGSAAIASAGQPGGSGGPGLPPGFEVAPSGPAIPSGTTGGTGGAPPVPGTVPPIGGANARAGVPTPDSNAVIGAMNAGRVAGSVAQNVVMGVGKFGAHLVPGGQYLLGAAAKTVGAGVRLATTGASLLTQAYGRSRETGEGYVSSLTGMLRDATGAKGTGRALARTAGVVSADAFSPGLTPVVARKTLGTNVFDGYRYH